MYNFPTERDEKDKNKSEGKGDEAMVVNGIDVTVEGLEDVSEQEILSYIDYVKEHTDNRLGKLCISSAGDGNVTLNYALMPQKFERIRRITGYLVGTIDRWNDAKQAEEHDRVKHLGRKKGICQ